MASSVVVVLYALILLSGIVTQTAQAFVQGGFTVNGDQFTLRWDVHHHFITFKAIAKGTGFVGFGLSPKGTMEDSDLFISGMYDNGTVYANDYHGATVEKDAVNNYVLLYIMQGSMYTEVHFRRTLHTGDCKEDIAIMNEPQYVIWSIGPEMDKFETHGPMNRGAVLVNLLNPPMFHAHYYTPDKKPADPSAMMCMDAKPPPTNKDAEMAPAGGEAPPAENVVEVEP